MNGLQQHERMPRMQPGNKADRLFFSCQGVQHQLGDKLSVEKEEIHNIL